MRILPLFLSVVAVLFGCPGPDAASAAVEVEQVTYRSGGLELSGYLSRPKGTAPFPAVLYNHGGFGETIGGAPAETARALAAAGYVGFSPIRREDISMEGNLQDVLAALRYLRTLPDVDPGRVCLMGFSRGGLLTLMAAVEWPDLKAVVAMAPAPGRGHADRFLPQVGRISAPVLLLVAENDRVQADHVRIARQFKEALESAGRPVQLVVYPPYGRDGHRMFFEVGEYWGDVLSFLREHL